MKAKHTLGEQQRREKQAAIHAASHDASSPKGDSMSSGTGAKVGQASTPSATTPAATSGASIAPAPYNGAAPASRVSSPPSASVKPMRPTAITSSPGVLRSYEDRLVGKLVILRRYINASALCMVVTSGFLIAYGIGIVWEACVHYPFFLNLFLLLPYCLLQLSSVMEAMAVDEILKKL
jgi:hypothetical protein